MSSRISDQLSAIPSDDSDTTHSDKPSRFLQDIFDSLEPAIQTWFKTQASAGSAAKRVLGEPALLLMTLRTLEPDKEDGWDHGCADALASCARVSWGFHTVAASILWRRTSALRLLALIPFEGPPQEPSFEGRHWLSDAPPDLSRVSLYAPHIRELEQRGRDEWAQAELGVPNAGGDLLRYPFTPPPLKHAEYIAKEGSIRFETLTISCASRYTTSCLLALVHRGVQRLEVRLPPYPNGALAEQVAESSFYGAIRAVERSGARLTAFAFCKAPRSALGALSPQFTARMCTLRLNLHCGEVDIVEPTHAAQPIAQLDSLQLEGLQADMLPYLRVQGLATHLRSLELKLPPSDAPDMLVSFTASVVEATRGVALQSIRLTHIVSWAAVKEAPSRPCMAVIEHLIRAFAASLVNLGLHTRSAITGFSDEDLAHTLTSLPNLTSLSVRYRKPDASEGELSAAFPTRAALYIIARRFPNLRELELPTIDTRAAFTNDHPPPSPHKLEHLRLPMWKCRERGASQVLVEILRDLFPRVTLGRAWQVEERRGGDGLDWEALVACHRKVVHWKGPRACTVCGVEHPRS